jgi:outer membrane protein assembly factor BamB
LKKIIVWTLCLVFLNSCAWLHETVGVEGIREKGTEFHPLWIKNHDPIYESGNLPIALNSPLIHEDSVFAGNGNGEMVAYDLKDGREIWRQKDKGGYFSQPVVYNEFLVYGTNEGRLYARHTITGELKYAVDLGASVESQPVIYKGRMFIHTRNHKIFSLDAQSGKILWAYKRSVPYTTTLQRVSRPLVVGDKIIVGFADGHVAAFSLEEGVLLWESRINDGSKFVDVDATPVVHQGKLYMASHSGPLTVMDPLSGNILRKLDYNVTRAPISHGNSLVFGTVDGELVHLDENFKEVKKVKLSKDALSSIVWWKKKLVVSTSSGKIFLVWPKNFQSIESFSLGHSHSAIFGNLQVGENKLATISSRNRLYVFR